MIGNQQRPYECGDIPSLLHDPKESRTGVRRSQGFPCEWGGMGGESFNEFTRSTIYYSNLIYLNFFEIFRMVTRCPLTAQGESGILYRIFQGSDMDV